MKRKSSFHVVMAATMVLGTASMTAGCANQSYSSPQEQAEKSCRAFGPKTLSGALIGTLSGAAGGASIGAIAAGGKGAAIGTGIGAVAGLLGGSIYGNQLDKRDCAAAQTALAQAASSSTLGQVVSWNEPATGSHGTYTSLTALSTAPSGEQCRMVRQQSQLANHQQTTQDEMTCRNAEGDWYVPSQTAANTNVGQSSTTSNG